MKGAAVADVLDILLDHDAHLDVLEPMRERLAGNLENPRLLGPAALAVLYAYGEATDEKVLELIARLDN